MKNSKLLFLLKGLKTNELHWFQKFLNSPFYNSNKEHIALFQHLKKYYPDLDSPKLDKAKAFQKIYPREKFDIQKMRKLMHGLALLVEEFMVAMQLRNHPFEKKKVLTTALGERNIYEQFKKGTEEMIGKLEALPYRDSEYFKGTFEFNLNLANHVETNRQKLNTHILKTATEHLDYFYLLQKQQLTFAIKNHERLHKKKISLKSLAQTKTALQEEPTFKLYQLVIQTLTSTNNNEGYSEIEHLFKSKINTIRKKERSFFIRILINHLGNQINQGKKGFHTKLLNLYKFGLEQEIFIENNKINESTFINISTVAIHEKEFEWTENFILSYKNKLPNTTSSDATNLSLGNLFYHRKEYDQAIDLLLNYSFSKPLLVLQSKVILLRIHFEQYIIDRSYYDFLFSQVQSFEKYIRRNNFISNSKKEIFLNLVLIVRKILVDHSQNTLDIKLLRKIKSTKPLALKLWLLEKVEELIKK